MSFQLVIAEKPSVARSIAAVIGADEKQNVSAVYRSGKCNACQKASRRRAAGF